jgi:prevent-host-death family protein
MDVAVSDLRSNLSQWLEQVKDGEELVVTERGRPVARVVRVASVGAFEELVASGQVSLAPSTSRPRARGQARPRVATSLSEWISDSRR